MSLSGTFGINVSNFDDVPSRAVLASINICQSLIDMGIPTFIGISSGVTYCGVVGTLQQRCEYFVVGDVVDTSTRLMKKAMKNQKPIYVDLPTKVGACKFVEFRSKGTMKSNSNNEIFVPSIFETEEPEINETEEDIQKNVHEEKKSKYVVDAPASHTESTTTPPSIAAVTTPALTITSTRTQRKTLMRHLNTMNARYLTLIEPNGVARAHISHTRAQRLENVQQIDHAIKGREKETTIFNKLFKKMVKQKTKMIYEQSKQQTENNNQEQKESNTTTNNTTTKTAKKTTKSITTNPTTKTTAKITTRTATSTTANAGKILSSISNATEEEEKSIPTTIASDPELPLLSSLQEGGTINIAVIEGDIGIGKSRLAQTLTSNMKLEGGNVIFGSAAGFSISSLDHDQLEQNIDMYPFRTVLIQLLDLDAFDNLNGLENMPQSKVAVQYNIFVKNKIENVHPSLSLGTFKNPKIEM